MSKRNANSTSDSTARDKDQRERFAEAARALGCDENEAAFDEKLKALAPPRPKPAAAGVVVEYQIMPDGELRRVWARPMKPSDAAEP